jgi:alpha-glucosidase (family GH31 glycosyl hydrolase)
VQVTRRTLLKGAATASIAPAKLPKPGAPIRIGGRPVEIAITSVSANTLRISISPLENGQILPIPHDGSLVRQTWGPPSARITGVVGERNIRCGDLTVKLSSDPLTMRVETRDGRVVQQLRVNSESGALNFLVGNGPLLGLGQGGPQFDRRGSIDRMRSGQGGYRLQTHGGRVPIPWLIGTEGWAMYVHQPKGSFDLSGIEGRFDPGGPGSALPLDIFVVGAREPAKIMAEYARLTGYVEMPPLWAFGYMQSHRTLANREEVISVARTFRENQLPCDALIYLGTGFCPSGWNTGHGSFKFNPAVFPDPEQSLKELHELHFKVALHVVIRTTALHGSARDRCDTGHRNDEEAACHWDAHRKAYALGVDGWWPDEGDSLDAASRLTRNRMYWEGSQLDRPNRRPFALHRNGHAGMQRYGAFLWSGDVYSTWETLRTHVAIAINTGLSGIPYWGTDIGGFIPTGEYTGELHVRWFQFGAFCTLFRAHGRTWHLRLPWGWNTGDLGINEISNYAGGAANPDAAELHNEQVEPICRKYLNLRYRMLPYLYSAVREGTKTGLPVMRALWLHYPDDREAVARGDEYLWGRDILVAPVTEKGAKSRSVYLPPGDWYDFWTEERFEGGREIARPVDLALMPLFVRAGTIIPLGPVKQFTGEKVEGPLTLTAYPGANGEFTLYEDDGISFDYRKGAWMGIHATFDNKNRRLMLSLAAGSRMLSPLRREIDVRVAGELVAQRVVFTGRPLIVTLPGRPIDSRP